MQQINPNKKNARIPCPADSRGRGWSQPWVGTLPLSLLHARVSVVCLLGACGVVGALFGRTFGAIQGSSADKGARPAGSWPRCAFGAAAGHHGTNGRREMRPAPAWVAGGVFSIATRRICRLWVSPCAGRPCRGHQARRTVGSSEAGASGASCAAHLGTTGARCCRSQIDRPRPFFQAITHLHHHASQLRHSCLVPEITFGTNLTDPAAVFYPAPLSPLTSLSSQACGGRLSLAPRPGVGKDGNNNVDCGFVGLVPLVVPYRLFERPAAHGAQAVAVSAIELGRGRRGRGGGWHVGGRDKRWCGVRVRW